MLHPADQAANVLSRAFRCSVPFFAVDDMFLGMTVRPVDWPARKIAR